MATGTTTKKPCFKCNKGGATFTCDGCHQSFCLKHASEHRQELSQRMDDIGQQHDILKRDIDEQTINKTLLAQIDRWEKESIEKIRSSADQARSDLKRLTDESKLRLNDLMSKLSNELRLNRENDDYTEDDLGRWMKQLMELQKELEKPSEIELTEDKVSSVSLLKLKKESAVQNNDSGATPQNVPRAVETFNKAIGSIVLSKDGCSALCVSRRTSPIIYSSVGGCLQYSSGSYNLRFRLDTAYGSAIFIGIIAAFQSVVANSSAMESAYGYWSDGSSVRAGPQIWTADEIVTQHLNDEVILILNCSSNKIIYAHQQTKRRNEMKVDLKICPLPWKLVVTLWHPNDKIEILNS